MSRRPTLVCLNGARATVTRYAPKATGGFFTEVFEVTDPAGFAAACTPETIEALRRGKLRDQVPEAELEDQIA